MSEAPMRRLRDYPAIDELEHRSVLDTNLLAPAAIAHPETGIADAIKSVFGLDLSVFVKWLFDDDGSAREAYAVIPNTEAEVVPFFAELGWDVTDKRGQPLRMLYHYVLPLYAAIRGDAGATLPGAPLAKTEDWAAAMERDARKFRPSASKGSR